jgi:hypothetical protein
MVVGYLTVDIMLANTHSLKEKRMVIKSIKDKARSKFNISIAQLDNHDRWQHAILGIAAVGNNKNYVNKILDCMLEWMEGIKSIYIFKQELRFVP